LRTRSGACFESNRTTQKMRYRYYSVTAKIGQLCELDPGHILNRTTKTKMSNKTLPAKFRNLYLRNFAEFREIIVTKFREIGLNFVLILYFAK
jgi:hypothetical protein